MTDTGPDAPARDKPAFVPGEAYYRALVESALDVVVVYDADGTTRYVSPSVKGVFDFSPGELVGKPGLDFVHPDDVAPLRVALAEASRKPGRRVRIEVRLRHRDGSWRLMESLVTSFLEDASIAGTVVASRDVTEARETAAQLAHAQRMEAVGRLAENVAHEFKNTLSVVVGHTELALGRLPEGDPLRPGLEAIQRSATRAVALARQLLAFGRRDASAKARVEAAAAMSAAASLLAPLLGKTVRLELDAQPGAGSVLADPAELEQALVNLVLNARDAMPGGGVVTLAVREALFDGEEARRRPGLGPGRYVVFSVRDTGVGIAPDVMPRLFEPFFTTKPSGKGTGLGLSTVYGFALRGGGTAWAEGKPGKGATFFVALPRLTEEVPPTSPPSGSG